MSSTLYVVGFVIAVIVCGGLIWYFNHRADRKAAEEAVAKRKAEVDAAERRRNRRQSWENPVPYEAHRPKSQSNVPSAERGTTPSSEGDFATSMVVGYATDNAIIGGLVGGSLTGGIIGAAMNNSEPRPAAPAACAPAPSYDGGSSCSDSGSSSSSSTD